MAHKNAAPVFDCDQHEDDVLAWRTAKFLELGFLVTEAARLADLPVDWHEADALITDGCPPHLAARILTPL